LRGVGAPTPSRSVVSRDGTRIAVFSSGDPAARPLLLVHGTTADHTTFRAVEPLLVDRFAVHAIDRRGRGASGDGPVYDIEREFEDVTAVADALAAERGGPVDVVGQSYGGRCSLGAALLTVAIRRLVVYEGAPQAPGVSFSPPGFVERFEGLLAGGEREAAVESFFRVIVGMDDGMVAAYRSNPTWPVRVAAADTILRELHSAPPGDGGMEALATLQVPILQILGSESPPAFRAAAEALDARLRDGRIVVIDGAAHAAHHTHAGAFVDALSAFLSQA